MRRAFTLIELMIALAVGLFVVAAMYNLFSDQVKQFVYQDIQMEMHQNQRLATDILTRTARLAGYGTGGSTNGVFGAGGVSDEPLPAIISYNGTGDNGSDAITIVSMDPALVMNTAATSPPECAATELTFNPAVLNNATKLAQFGSGELVMCYDYAALGGYRSFLWQLSSDANASTGLMPIADSSVYGDYATTCAGIDNLPLIMSCSRAEVVTFYIDANESDGVGAGSASNPVLMMDMDFESPDADDVPLVDNVEDLQLNYCLQSAAGTTDCSDPSAWIDSLTSDQAAEVYMIRVSLVIRSGREDPRDMHQGTRPGLADNPESSTIDHYFRQVISTEVVVKNMRIQMNLP